MANLLRDVEAFIETHEIAESRFGVEALEDKNFIRDLRNGRRVWPETEARVRSFMDAYQPARDAA
jgi:hypothetical protein